MQSENDRVWDFGDFGVSKSVDRPVMPVQTDRKWSTECQQTLLQCRCSVFRSRRTAQTDTLAARGDLQKKQVLSADQKKTKLYYIYMNTVIGRLVVASVFLYTGIYLIYTGLWSV